MNAAPRFSFAALLAFALLAACSPQPAPTETPLPTPTLFPTYSYRVPTSPPQFATVAATVQAAGRASGNLDPELVERGRSRYEALSCGECHGEQGEGTDDGSALAGTTLSEADFLNFLRTGGTIGNDHQYAQNRLSESGGHNLYLYVLSLAAPSAE